tara:strand:+ start:560 stop:823 length:264 start_codon:yes stop_codon:yes gene_type:complete
MQILLTQKEHKELLEAGELARTAVRTDIQELCKQVAMHKPVVIPWDRGGGTRTWGCILCDESEENPGCCDHCPVQSVCPCEHKSWSK